MLQMSTALVYSEAFKITSGARYQRVTTYLILLEKEEGVILVCIYRGVDIRERLCGLGRGRTNKHIIKGRKGSGRELHNVKLYRTA